MATQFVGTGARRANTLHGAAGAVLQLSPLDPQPESQLLWHSLQLSPVVPNSTSPPRLT